MFKNTRLVFTCMVLAFLAVVITYTYNGDPKEGIRTEEESHHTDTENLQHIDSDKLIKEPIVENGDDFTPLAAVSNNDINESQPFEEETENNEETKLTIESFDELITEADGKLYMETAPIESMDIQELSWFLSNLNSTMTQARTVEILQNINQEVESYKNERSDFFINDLQCSDMVCGVMFEAQSMSSIESALSEITSSSSFKNNTRGGTMRILEENGIYYGVIISSITEANISLR